MLRKHRLPFMSFVYRQLPAEISIRTRRNARRAALGIASCIASLAGINTTALHNTQARIETAQEAANNYLMPPHIQREAKQTATIPPSPAPVPSLASQRQELSEQTSSYGMPLAALGGMAITAYAAFIGLGLANRRSRQRDAHGHDVATEDTYALYPFEQTTSPAVYDTTYADQLDVRLTELEHRVNAKLIEARLGSELNLIHINVLKDLGQDPLQALTYPA